MHAKLLSVGSTSILIFCFIRKPFCKKIISEDLQSVHNLEDILNVTEHVYVTCTSNVHLDEKTIAFYTSQQMRHCFCQRSHKTLSFFPCYRNISSIDKLKFSTASRNCGNWWMKLLELSATLYEVQKIRTTCCIIYYKTGCTHHAILVTVIILLI